MFFFFSSRRRHTRLQGDWSSDVCSSDLSPQETAVVYVKDTDGNEIFQVYKFDPASNTSTLISDGKSRNTEPAWSNRSEEHTSELQSPCNLVCRLLLEKRISDKRR